MTKFKKLLLTILIISLVYFCYHYGYNYYIENKDKINNILNKNKSDVTDEEIDKITAFLSNNENIGYLQYNYNNIDINKLTIDRVVELNLFKYYMEENKNLIQYNLISDSYLFKKYDGTYNENKLCLNLNKINEKLIQITNQTYKSNNKTICINDYTSNFTYIDPVIIKVKANDDLLNIDYTIKSVSNYLYVQKNNYQNLNIYDLYNGKLVLKRHNNSYMFISNNIDNINNLY